MTMPRGSIYAWGSRQTVLIPTLVEEELKVRNTEARGIWSVSSKSDYYTGIVDSCRQSSLELASWVLFWTKMLNDFISYEQQFFIFTTMHQNILECHEEAQNSLTVFKDRGGSYITISFEAMPLYSRSFNAVDNAKSFSCISLFALPCGPGRCGIKSCDDDNHCMLIIMDDFCVESLPAHSTLCERSARLKPGHRPFSNSSNMVLLLSRGSRDDGS